MEVQATDAAPRTSEPDERPTKRRRVALACNACRTRKSRCDGRRPICATCKSLGFECEYEPSDASTNVIVPKDYVSDLEQRLKHVEQALQRHDDLLTGHLSLCSKGARPDRGQLRELRTPVESANDGPRLEASEFEDDRELEEPKTDGMAITFVSENASAFFGESSNIAFTRYLLQAMSARWKAKELKDPATASIYRPVEHRSLDVTRELSPSVMETPSSADISVSTLPPEMEMEHLLTLYFGATGSLFPFIHEPTFRKTYDEFKASGFTRVRRTWLGLLNMTFALACNVDLGGVTSIKNRLEKSRSYYARAEALCSGPSRRTISLEIVQYLLLVVLYLQGAQRSTHMWSLHGLLVRTATALGLHSDQAGLRLDPVQQEIRRRTWLTIYCLDKVLSVAFGRPPSIPEEHMIVGLPAPWPILQGSTGCSQITAPNHSSEYMRLSVQLYQIMGQSLVRQYNSNLGNRDEDFDAIKTIQSAGEIRQTLRRWASDLPSHLAICQSNSQIILENTDQNRLRIILTLRYHNLNILIHRPLLCATLRFLTTQETQPVESPPYTIQLAMAEAHECIQSAQSTIDIVHSILVVDQTGHNNLGVWFFTLYYVFTASLIVCGRALWAQYGKNTDDEATISSACSYLTKAAEALERLECGILLVQNCARYIRCLSDLQDGELQTEVASRISQRERRNDQKVQAEEQQNIEQQTTITSDMPDLAEFIGSDMELNQMLGFDVFRYPFSDVFIPSMDI